MSEDFINRLPDEILDEILQEVALPVPGLSPLLICKRWAQIYTPHLYSHVRLRPHYGHGRSTAVVALDEAMTNKAYLGRYARKLDMKYNQPTCCERQGLAGVLVHCGPHIRELAIDDGSMYNAKQKPCLDFLDQVCESPLQWANLHTLTLSSHWTCCFLNGSKFEMPGLRTLHVKFPADYNVVVGTPMDSEPSSEKCGTASSIVNLKLSGKIYDTPLLREILWWPSKLETCCINQSGGLWNRHASQHILPPLSAAQCSSLRELHLYSIDFVMGVDLASFTAVSELTIGPLYFRATGEFRPPRMSRMPPNLNKITIIWPFRHLYWATTRDRDVWEHFLRWLMTLMHARRITAIGILTLWAPNGEMRNVWLKMASFVEDQMIRYLDIKPTMEFLEDAPLSY